MNAALECVSVTRDSFDADFVRKFVQIFRDYKIGARLVLLDSEFYSANVMNALSASGNRYLMPAVKNDGIKKAAMECRHGLRNAASMHAMKNSAGRCERFVLITMLAARPDGGDNGRKAREITDDHSLCHQPADGADTARDIGTAGGAPLVVGHQDPLQAGGGDQAVDDESQRHVSHNPVLRVAVHAQCVGRVTRKKGDGTQ